MGDLMLFFKKSVFFFTCLFSLKNKTVFFLFFPNPLLLLLFSF